MRARSPDIQDVLLAAAALVLPFAALLAVSHAARASFARLVPAFAGGAAVALAARAVNDLVGAGDTDLGFVVVAPAIEECAKALVLLAFAARRPHDLRDPATALALGAGVGLGFSVVENLAYALGDANAWGVLVARSVTATPIHAAATAAVAAGASLALRAPRWQAAALAAGGIVLHGVYNASLAFLPTTRIVGELYTRGIVVILLAGAAFTAVVLAADRLSRTSGESP